MKENLPLFLLGCVIVASAAVLGVYFTKALPAVVPLVILGFGSFVVPPVLFALYNLILLGQTRTSATLPAVAMTGIFILLIGVSSVYFYMDRWDTLHVERLTVYGWMVMNCVLAAGTICMFIFAAKSRAVERLLWTHIIMFSWFYTFAFPWLAESL